MMKQADTREINAILDHLEGWERKSTIRCGPYNIQRGYMRIFESRLGGENV
jgi:hypothetical protein